MSYTKVNRIRKTATVHVVVRDEGRVPADIRIQNDAADPVRYNSRLRTSSRRSWEIIPPKIASAHIPTIIVNEDRYINSGLLIEIGNKPTRVELLVQ